MLSPTARSVVQSWLLRLQCRFGFRARVSAGFTKTLPCKKRFNFWAVIGELSGNRQLAEQHRNEQLRASFGRSRDNDPVKRKHLG